MAEVIAELTMVEAIVFYLYFKLKNNIIDNGEKNEVKTHT